MIAQKSTKEMEALFPLLSVEQDLIISKQADVTACFELQLPEVFTLSQGRFEALPGLWLAAVLCGDRPPRFHPIPLGAA